MKLFLPFRRATLLVPSGPAHDPEQKHLFIVLTDPAEVLDFDEKHSLLVGVTTIHTGIPHDPACEFHAGDHSFIRHKSYADYARARIEPSRKIIDGVKKGVFTAQALLDEALFAHVCRGIAQSRFAAPKVVSFYEAVQKAKDLEN
ncbi:MAG: hypothetical protein K8S22_06050 [Betaproteobacteria bacterium]|nr:hypothetical protein [Betaproteobacteria bacterium]